MIGLLTFHDTNNFGSYLQTYGLYKKIIDLGGDCEVIDYQSEELIRREIPQPFCWSWNPKVLIRSITFDKVKRRKYMNLSTVFRKLMKHSPRYDIKNITAANTRFSTMLIGSDIVWGLDITAKDMSYFLDFADDNISKNAFSASVGNKWDESEKKMVAPYLQRFKEINVREIEAADWVREIVPQKEVNVVCDPTMLLTAAEWEELESKRYKEDKYVLVYFDTNNKDCLISAKEYAKKHGLKVFLINYGRPVKHVKNLRPTSIGDFLALLHNATFVVTASYHGMLFSIYYNRQFAYFNRAHKSRMNTLAEVLEVSCRNGADNKVCEMEQLDYVPVNAAVERFRLYSIGQLIKIVENERHL